jgi:hypothetical protein
MGNRLLAVWLIFLLLVTITALSAPGISRVSAASIIPPGPDRFEVVTQDYTLYHWWLVNWADDIVACTIAIDHSGLPFATELETACGATLYGKWSSTLPCETAEGDSASCKGYYLHFYKTEPAQKQVGVALPPAQVWVTLDGCEPFNSTFFCQALPSLVLIGEEPMTGEHITRLAGRINGEPFICDPICQVDLVPTNDAGTFLEFWAESSYGDTSPLFNARVRVVASGSSSDDSWYVDILSLQWRGEPLAPCSQIWNVFPPEGGVPLWLFTPSQPGELATDIPYEYLAANLIEHGVVDASTCADAGLAGEDLVSPCGMEKARSAVTDWQNRFDALILASAQETGIPARLLKSIFSRESQFWPAVSGGREESGLGQMTIGGADATLLWNTPFYEQFCPAYLDPGSCALGYAHLDSPQKDSLRNALVNSVNASCRDCPEGIDWDLAEQSVGIFAETLLANCSQAGMVVELNDRTGGSATLSYADLWRFTLVNYNAGPGCLGLAINKTSSDHEPLNWEHVSSHLTPVCQGALSYVTDINSVSP